MPAPSNGEKGLGKHPTRKPIGLVQRCLLASTNQGDIVLDPFLRSGTTALAGIRTGHQCVGIEWEPQCLDPSIARVEAETRRSKGLFASRCKPSAALP